MSPAPALSFHQVDELEHAAAQGKLDAAAPVAHSPVRIGPLLELLQFSKRSGFELLEPWIEDHLNGSMVSRLRHRRCAAWLGNGGRLGFVRSVRRESEGVRLNGFLIDAQRAAHQVSGLTKKVARQLVAALGEMENNIREHSDATDTGFVAFQAEEGAFEFVASDRGIGVLRSLRRCDAYAAIRDEGQALRTALQQGESRFGPNTRHGNGFRPIFVGLANIRCDMRFRSGDHALEISGSNSSLLEARISQKAALPGFFVNVRCLVP